MSEPPGEERAELRSSLRRFLQDHAPLRGTRLIMDTGDGYDREVWFAMAGQLGLTGLPIPEEFGGAGGNAADLAVVMEELGRALLPSPYLASIVLAAAAIQNCGDDAARKEWLPRLAAGELLATMAAVGDDGQWQPHAATVTAVPSSGRYRLSGHTSFALDGQIADLILVTAQTDHGVSLFAVYGDAPGLCREALPVLDQTRRQSRIGFTYTPARLVGPEGRADAGLAKTFDLASVALAAEQLGGAQRCLEMALAYAKERIAFGRPIGGFQAIKHKLADLLIEVEFARSAVDHATGTATNGCGDLTVAASLARAHCSETFALTAAENIHIHGGIGFTWEHDAQLYFKRAKSSQLMFGDAAFHRERIAAALLDEPAGRPAANTSCMEGDRSD